MFRPMLAASLPTGDNKDLEKLDWSKGFWCSPKLDGIRAIMTNKGLISRTLKLIPNQSVQRRLEPYKELAMFFDGELVLGESMLTPYNDTQSYMMTEVTEDKPFSYYVFDDINRPGTYFQDRNMSVWNKLMAITKPIITYCPQIICKDIDALLEYEAMLLAQGFEGVIMRDPLRPYKNNRSTFREQGMIKLKRFNDAEAEIIGFEELVRNTNPAERDERGYTKRSDHKANQVPAGTLGLFLCRGINGQFAGIEFGCGSGLDESLRAAIWQDREAYRGRIIKYKYQSTGSKDKPRSPIFLGFRPEGA